MYVESQEAGRAFVPTTSGQSAGLLPWMLPTNHGLLARNLRLADIGKPDRWLIRFAERFGYRDVDETLSVVERISGDDHSLADIYIWAYLSENPEGLAEWLQLATVGGSQRSPPPPTQVAFAPSGAPCPASSTSGTPASSSPKAS